MCIVFSCYTQLLTTNYMYPELIFSLAVVITKNYESRCLKFIKNWNIKWKLQRLFDIEVNQNLWKIYYLNREIHLCKRGFLSNEYNQSSNLKKSRNLVSDYFDDDVSCSKSYHPFGQYQSLISIKTQGFGYLFCFFVQLKCYYLPKWPKIKIVREIQLKIPNVGLKIRTIRPTVYTFSPRHTQTVISGMVFIHRISITH